MNRVTSKDGTWIAYERIGTGPAVILDLAVLARPGGPCAHPRLRRGLRGRRPPTHRPARDDHAADPGGHWREEPGPARGRAATDFFDQAADAIAASIPQAERLIIEGQGHVADPKAVAPVLERFFGT